MQTTAYIGIIIKLFLTQQNNDHPWVMSSPVHIYIQYYTNSHMDADDPITEQLTESKVLRKLWMTFSKVYYTATLIVFNTVTTQLLHLLDVHG